MASANINSLVQHIEEAVPGWIEAALSLERKKSTKKAWYTVPLVVLAQILHPVSVNPSFLHGFFFFLLSNIIVLILTNDA